MNIDQPAMAVEEISDAAMLDRVSDAWHQLWQSDPMATPFQSPEWLIPWWRHIGQGELLTLALRQPLHDGPGRLVGLLPLYIYRDGQSRLRQLFPIGIGTTDYLDGLFAAGWEESARAAALAYLDAHRDRWDVCDFPQLRERSHLLTARIPRYWCHHTQEREPCPVLELPDTATALRDRLPTRLMQNVRYYRRRAQRLGMVRFELADEANLDELRTALFHLHGARWAKRELPGVLADDAVRHSHREAMPRLLKAGLLRLYAMRIDGCIVAALYALADGAHRPGRAYYYLSGFDPAYSQLSPGTLIIAHAVEEAIHDGAGEFDFLRGGESYKYLWGAVDRAMFRRRLWHPPMFTRPTDARQCEDAAISLRIGHA